MASEALLDITSRAGAAQVWRGRLALLTDVNRVLLSPSAWGAGLPDPLQRAWPHDEMRRFRMPHAMAPKKRKD